MNFSEYLGSCNRAQIFLMGPQRVGKTTLAYSVSNLGKTLGIEGEGGVHAAKDFINARNLEIEPITKMNKVNGKWVPLPPEKQPPIRERLKELVLKAFTGGYKYVVVDSITDIAGRFEDEYARTVGVVDLRDWGRIIEGVKSLIRDLRNGSFNLIVTAIAGAPKDGALLEVQPVLPGQLREVIAPVFETICLVHYSKKDKRRKLIVNDPALGCVDRFHSFGDAREVDIDGKPAEVMKVLMEAPLKEGSEDAEEGGSEEPAAVSAPVVVPVRKVISRPFGVRPVVKRV